MKAVTLVCAAVAAMHGPCPLSRVVIRLVFLYRSLHSLSAQYKLTVIVEELLRSEVFWVEGGMYRTTNKKGQDDIGTFWQMSTLS